MKVTGLARASRLWRRPCLQNSNRAHLTWQHLECVTHLQTSATPSEASTRETVEDEIAHLRGLDLKGLRARWQSMSKRPAPTHLTRHLLFAVIAYRIQADRFGDLDHATQQMLDRTAAKESGSATSARLASFDQKRTELTPGTVLVREWDRQRHSG